MLLRSWIVAGLAVCWSMVGVANAGDPPETQTFKLDAVEVLSGRETPGDAAIFVDHYNFRYLFATPANREAFLKDPSKYEVQLGGACGKMGPLSGTGSPARHAVCDGKLYFFASDGCRETFKKDPAARLDPPDAKPTGDAAAMKRGREMFERMVTAMGGAARLNAINAYTLSLDEEVEAGGKKYHHVESWTVKFPEDVRHSDSWSSPAWVYCWTGGPSGSGAAWHEQESFQLHPQQREALEKVFFRQPLFIAKAGTRSDFVAVSRGAGKMGERNVELVDVWFGGVGTTLGLDPSTGKLSAIQYRGRGAKGAFGSMVRVFGGEREADGVLVPTTTEASFEGVREPQKDSRLTSVEINPALHEAAFRAPKG